ncbi:MAG: hypothetical protein AB1411_09575 [Nitrospirota bacterium]
MINLVILATTLWVCPGDVYSNEPKPGCKPFHPSDKEGFTVIPEAQQAPAAPQSPTQAPGSVIIEENVVQQKSEPRPRASSKECELYDEYLTLSTKSRGIGALELTTAEYERWTLLKNMFNIGVPPVCDPQTTK